MDWLYLSEYLGYLAKNIKNNDEHKIEMYLCLVFKYLFNIMKHYNIDMETAWKNWKIKAFNKVYIN